MTWIKNTNASYSTSQTSFVTTLWGAVMERLLPVSTCEIPRIIAMAASAEPGPDPLNLAPSSILRPSRAGFTDGRRNPS